METTSLYVELVIIGLETTLWITSYSIWLTDIKYLSVLTNAVEKLPASVFLLGIMYVLGLIVDRVADLSFKKVENRIRNSSGLEVKSSILIWKRNDQENYFKYTRSKIRILRASSINIPIFTVSVLLNIFKYYNNIFLLLYVAVIGGGLTYFSFKGFKQATRNYYNKARILELELQKKDNK